MSNITLGISQYLTQTFGDYLLTYRLKRLYIANVPPSPASSAQSTIKTYLTVTIRVSDQIIRDKAPTRSSYDGSEENVDEYT